MEEDKKELPLMCQVKEQVEKEIKKVLNENVGTSNVDYLYRLIDVHKDIENEKFWKEGKNMRYGNYEGFGNYGNNYGDNYGRRMRDSRGRYTEGNYGRRGIDSKYRGDEIMDDMYQNYGEYQETKGMYGAENDKMKSLKYMLKAMEDFGMYLMEDADSEEEKQMIKQTLRKMGEK